MAKDNEAEKTELAHLSTRVERERKARREAEDIAERGLRALYEKEKEGELLRALAAAANEAENTRDALRLCLDRVCDYIGWPVGHVFLPVGEGSGMFRSSGIWRLRDPDRFQVFRDETEAMLLRNSPTLPNRAIAEAKPIWIVDVTTNPEFVRREAAKADGIRSALAVPVLAGQEVVAVLEFFTQEALPPDEHLLEVMANVGTQLGRVAERERAAEVIHDLNCVLEQRVRERTAELESAVRELESFTYTVAHDLRSPLRAMDGFARILIEDYAAQLPEDARDCLHRVRGGSQQMGRLIDDLLAFARLGREKLEWQTVNVTGVARQAFTQLRPVADNRRVDFEVGTMPVCYADPERLKLVFFHLLSNALKFTRSRALARIEVGCVSGMTPGGRPRTAGDKNDERTFFVKDNGVGFDMQYRGKLFGVFQRLHRIDEFEGNGIGLAVAKRIIERHGGQIWAEAEVDKGATFYFTLGGGPS